MKRPAHTSDTLERIRRWRAICPELTLRSTFIVGFPGETEQDFEELLTFLREAQLDRVGCFTYSPVAGASANQYANPVPETLKKERQAELMALQANISAQCLQRKIGHTLTVLVDAIDTQGNAIARSTADAPEIDGLVRITKGATLAIGEFAQVRIRAADAHDLYAELLTKPKPSRTARRNKILP
jgi:ribosomal protein S12 methylthiotransferase